MASPRRSLRSRLRPSAFLNRYVVLAFALQVIGGGVWFATVEHGDPAALTGLFRALPTPAGLLLGVFAVPAVAVTVAVGAALEFATGTSLRAPGIGLLSDDDLPFLVVAYLLSIVVGAWIAEPWLDPGGGGAE